MKFIFSITMIAILSLITAPVALQNAEAAHTPVGTYADTVIDYSPGFVPNPANPRENANNAIDGLLYHSGSTVIFVSLWSGSITLEFSTPVGGILNVYEATNGSWPLESAQVEVSPDGVNWTILGDATNQGGVAPNILTSFDLEQLEYTDCVSQVRLTENTPNKPTGSGPDYFDLDAISGTEEKECVVEGSLIHVEKFYDADLNGIQDNDLELEPNIEGWLVEVTPFFNGEIIGTSSTFLTTAWIEVSSGTYVVAEEQVDNWAPTNHIPTVIDAFFSDGAIVVSSSTTVTVSPGEEVIVEFGNVCLADGGAHSKGFWGNKNGKSLFENGDDGVANLALINGLPLANQTGTITDIPNLVNYLAYKQWSKDAHATNMAYMLSAQLAAMVLNLHNLPVEGTDIVWSPELGFITIDDLIAQATAALAADGYTPDGDEPNRTDQENLKDALDDANNNLNFVQTAQQANAKDVCGDFEFVPEPEPEPELTLKPEKGPKGNNKNK